MIRNFTDMIARAAALPDRRIALAMAEEPGALEAVERARRLGIASGVLIGDAAAIRRELAGLAIPAADYEIVDAADPADAAARAVRLVAEGRADLVMKGVIDTNVLLHAVLDHDHGLREARLLSHVAVFEIDRYPKLLAMTDGGMVIAPDLEEKVELIRNALIVTRALGVGTAKVAAVAAKEKVNPRMQATVDAAELARREFEGAIVEGPIALDGALSRTACATKHLPSRIAGDVDILLVPQIESGNVFYKTLMYLGHAQVAGIVVGARRPIVLASRADDATTKLNSIALAVIVADAQAAASPAELRTATSRTAATG